VTGEQHYDPKSREWKTSTWSVDIANDLADAAGIVVAHANGKMKVDSKMLSATPGVRQTDADRDQP
jgi:hypothetical protein